MRRVAITQPYVPGYRVRLWELVIDLLRVEGIEARVFSGNDAEDAAAIALRGDASSAEWAETVPARSLRIPLLRRKLRYRVLPASWSGALLVTEMEATNANAWAALLRGKRYITLGHGKAYTAGDNALGDGLESFLNRMSAHALTYTEEGRATVRRRSRLGPDRVTAFHNATDTRELSDALDTVTAADEAAFASTHGIPDHARLALFIGALNEHKRIDLLVKAAKSVFEQDPRWWLVVAGEGPESDQLDLLAAQTGRVVRLGQAAPIDYAPAAVRSDVLLNPGRIGLIAVDALVMKLPVLTANAAPHAPEAGYLTEGVTLFSSSPSADAFAELWMSAPTLLAVQETASVPSVENAARAIATVIVNGVAGERGARSIT